MIRRPRAGSDDGFTLIEVLVAISLFMIFAIVMTATLTVLTHSISNARAKTDSSGDALVVVENLDHQVRYADSINFAGVAASGDSYIEFRIPAAASQTAVTTCYQWRYDPNARTIGFRSWPDTAGATPSAWSIKAQNVVGTASGSYPFQLVPAAVGTSNYQQLKLSISAGNGSSTDGTTVSTTYVARNSSIASPSNLDQNNDGVSDTPVCTTAGART